MNSTQFDSPFYGGGFVSQLSQSNDATPSTKSRDAHGVHPVTVKQISEASHSGSDKSNFMLDGVFVTTITVVGIVSEKTERVTDVGFILDDGTGRVSCRRWVNEGFDKKEMEEIQDGMYARVVGHLNTFQDQTQIGVFSIRPVKNFDEVPFHYIQCIYVHMQNTEKKPLAVNSSQNSPSIKIESIESSQVSGQYGSDVMNYDKLVLEYLQRPSNFEQEQGIHRDEVSRNLKLSVGKIMDALRNLEEEGLIYSTIDEYHYKSIVSG